MRAFVIFLGSLFVSFSAFANTFSHKLDTAILNAVQGKTIVKNMKSSFGMVYGGQDISRPLLATADESLWSGQRALIG